MEKIKVNLRLLRVQKLHTLYFCIILAQSSISELNRTKPNHDCSILFDIIRFGSIPFGHRQHKKLKCIEFDGFFVVCTGKLSFHRPGGIPCTIYSVSLKSFI